MTSSSNTTLDFPSVRFYVQRGVVFVLILLMILMPVLHSHRGQSVVNGWHVHFLNSNAQIDVAKSLVLTESSLTAADQVMTSLQPQSEQDSPEVDVPPSQLSKHIPDLGLQVWVLISAFLSLLSLIPQRIWIPCVKLSPRVITTSNWRLAAAAPPVLAPPTY